jgi:radical SAM-linked protein
MYGLPFETEEDVAAIPTLVAKAMRLTGGGGRTINVSAGVFVPKPHTPFQWARQATIAEAFQRIDFLKKNLPRNAKLKWNDPSLSFLEGVFARGDRRLAALIEQAWRFGARLDAWSEHFQLPLWRQAAAACGLDLDWYLRERDMEEVLPWQHLEAGIDADFLRGELAKAADEAYTPDCRNHGCQKCGLCDFKVIRPVVHTPADISPAAPAPHPPTTGGAPRTLYHYWIHYQRRGQARFLGHLELLQVIFRVLKRAEFPVIFSQGFNPSPKVSFSPALSVGIESLAEFLIAETETPLSDLESWPRRLSAQMPLGLTVTAVRLGPKVQSARMEVDYLVSLPRPLDQEVVDGFMASAEYPIVVERKKLKRTLDARKLVRAMRLVDAQTLGLTMAVEAAQIGVKPMELVANVFGLNHDEILASRLRKEAWRPLKTH